MTRQVNFEGQQRVDVPDMQAIQETATQDIRRVVRRLVMGSHADGGMILRGFAVEPTGPFGPPVLPPEVATSRVIVLLDNGGGDLSAAVGGINQGVADDDWGQVMGDRDGFGNLEGSSQNILDFAGQPADTYQVKIRATFTEGVNDNRAFWSPANNEEFIKETPTRRLPQWEIAFQNHADPEWVLLAEVIWSGATIIINDKREFPHEGVPYDTQIVSERWSHEEQDDSGSDTNGIGDFDRTHDRADAETAALWDVVRALQRQVQDLKGARDEDLRWDWYSRPPAPPGFYAADPSGKQVRNLRSLEAVTFTVADGVTDLGDFNGGSGINDCLAFIQANAGDLPGRIKIFVKQRGGGGNSWSWPVPITITGKHIELRGATLPAILHSDEVMTGVGHTRILGTGMSSPGTPMLTINQGSLYMENIAMMFPQTANTGVIECSLDSTFGCKNCLLQGHNSYAEGNAPVLRVSSQLLNIEDSFIRGVAYIGGKPEFSVGPGNPGNDYIDKKWRAGRVTNTVFEGLVRTRYDDITGTLADEQYWFARNLHFEKCWFQWDEELSGSGITSEFGQIDATGLSDSSFVDCEMMYSGDQTCLLLTSQVVSGSVSVGINNVKLLRNKFRLEFDATHAGHLTGAGGASGSEGTGWAVDIRDGASSAVIDKIYIEGNLFTGGFTANTTTEAADNSSKIVTPADAGFLRMRTLGSNVVGGGSWIRNNVFSDWAAPTAGQTSDIQRLIWIETSYTTYATAWMDTKLHFEGNVVRHFLDADFETPLAEFYVLRVDDVFHPEILNNAFILRTNAFSHVQSGNTMITFSDSQSAQIVGNYFEGGRRSSFPASNNTLVGLTGDVHNFRIDRNTFANFGGAGAVSLTGTAVANSYSFSHNVGVMNGMTTSDFAALFDAFDGNVNNGSIVGNRWDFDGTGGNSDAISLANTSTQGVIAGNVFPNGEIRVQGAGGAPVGSLRGYAEAQDLNYVNAYV